MKIPFFNYPDLFLKHKDSVLEVFNEVSSRGAFILQDDLLQFEKDLANFIEMEYVLGVANATDALQLLLKAGGVGGGDEVIFCSHTMIATASAIKFTGAKPVPVDAGADHLIDLDSIEAAITENTKAIMPTQLNGRIADMDKILQIADKYNLQVYEDSAQALGAKYKNRSAGSFGLGGCISFYPAKVLGCYGDGGAVLTNNKDIYQKVKLMRDHGRDETGNVSIWGFNSRLDNIQAAILNYFFKDYENVISRRRELSNLYAKNLLGIEKLKLPPSIADSPNNFDIYQNYEIEAQDRDALKDYLSENGVGTIIQWGGRAVHEFSDLGFNYSLPISEKIMRNSLLLPLNMSVTNEEVVYISELIRGFYNA